jgi:hypothetical protein
MRLRQRQAGDRARPARQSVQASAPAVCNSIRRVAVAMSCSAWLVRDEMFCIQALCGFAGIQGKLASRRAAGR